MPVFVSHDHDHCHRPEGVDQGRQQNCSVPADRVLSRAVRRIGNTPGAEPAESDAVAVGFTRIPGDQVGHGSEWSLEQLGIGLRPVALNVVDRVGGDDVGVGPLGALHLEVGVPCARSRSAGSVGDGQTGHVERVLVDGNGSAVDYLTATGQQQHRREGRGEQCGRTRNASGTTATHLSLQFDPDRSVGRQCDLC